MKQILIILVLVFTMPAFSDDSLTIKESMQTIGKNYGTLTQALFQQKEVNPSHLDNARAIQKASVDAATKQPDTAVTSQDQALYSQMMNELIKEAMEMETEIQAVLDAGDNPQDLSQCIEIHSKMDILKQDGHDKFL